MARTALAVAVVVGWLLALLWLLLGLTQAAVTQTVIRSCVVAETESRSC